MHLFHVETGTHLYGGALQVFYLLRGLGRRGIRNTLVCPRGSAIARAAAGVAEVAALPMAGDLDPAFPLRLRALVRSRRPDLVHVHSRRGADWWTPVAAAGTGVPLLVTRRVDNREPRWAAALKYRAYRRVVAISDGIRSVLVEEGVPPGRIDRVRSAVDTEAYAGPCRRTWFDRAFPVAAGKTAAGVVAQLIPRKGHRFLLEAAPALFGRFPDLRLLFFGRGPLEPALREECRRLGIVERVHFAGFRDDMPRILPCLDLLVHPATMEGLGVSLIQAAAAGVPVVAARAGGIPEVVADGENGLLVPPEDADALLEAVAALLAEPARAEAMGRRGRERAARLFSVDGMVEGNLAVYRSVLPRRGGWPVAGDGGGQKA